jgi:hypothetical protein
MRICPAFDAIYRTIRSDNVPSNKLLDDKLMYRAGSFLFIVFVVAAFLYDELLGIRAVGISGIICGVHWVREGKVPYGWRGAAPNGYFTGWGALGAAALVTGLGVWFLVAPKVVEPFFHHHRFV